MYSGGFDVIIKGEYEIWICFLVVFAAAVRDLFELVGPYNVRLVLILSYFYSAGIEPIDFLPQSLRLVVFDFGPHALW